MVPNHPPLSPELVVVIPAYNEEASIGAVLDEWLGQLRSLEIAFRALVLDDGSTDDTLARLRTLEALHPELEVRTHPNTGHGKTCRLGYQAALEMGAKWVFQIDSDGQCDPSHFPAFWQARETADALFGIRKSRDDGFTRTLLSHGCRWGVRLWTGVDTPDPNVPYRLIRSEALCHALREVPPEFELQNVAYALVLKRNPGVRCAYLPIHFRDRAHGTSLYTLPKAIATGLRMLKELREV